MRNLIIALFCLPAICAYDLAAACSPPSPDKVRLTPFEPQQTTRLADDAVPALPRNLDFEFDVLNPQGLDLKSVVIKQDTTEKAMHPELPLSFVRHDAFVRFRIHPQAPLPANTRFVIFGQIGKERRRLLQFITSATVDSTPPSLGTVQKIHAVKRFEPPTGSCDSGAARIHVKVTGTKDDASKPEQVRYLLEGDGEPQLHYSYCEQIELRTSGAAMPAQLRITPVDLAGNRGRAQRIAVPGAATKPDYDFAQFPNCPGGI